MNGNESKACPSCHRHMDPEHVWWWTGYGATCSEICARDLIRSHEGGIDRTAALPPDPAEVTEGDRDVATQITGCHREQATDCPFHGTADCGHRFAFCAAHDDARDMAWDECRWAPVAAALAAERAAATRPVLALAEELEAWRANAERYADAHAGSIACDRALGRVRAYERAAARLRAVVAAALGETGGGQ